LERLRPAAGSADQRSDSRYADQARRAHVAPYRTDRSEGPTSTTAVPRLTQVLWLFLDAKMKRLLPFSVAVAAAVLLAFPATPGATADASVLRSSRPDRPIRPQPRVSAPIKVGMISPSNSPGCLDLLNASGMWPSDDYPPDNTPVGLWPCHGNPNQLFEIEFLANDIVRIRSQWNENLCLAVRDNDNLEANAFVVHKCVNPSPGNSRQNFVYTRLGETDRIQFRPAYDQTDPRGSVRQCVDIYDSELYGPNLINLVRCDATFFEQPNQNFVLEHPDLPFVAAGDGQYVAEQFIRPLVGRLVVPTLDGATVCTASSVVSFNGARSSAASAAHCFDKWSGGPPALYVGYQKRNAASPTWVGFYSVDAQSLEMELQHGVDLALFSATPVQIPNIALHDLVGRYDIAFDGASESTTLYTYGYPSNYGNTNDQMACTSNTTDESGFPTSSAVCQLGPGVSGSPYAIWNTNTMIAVSSQGSPVDVNTAVGGKIENPHRTFFSFFDETTKSFGKSGFHDFSNCHQHLESDRRYRLRIGGGCVRSPR